MNVEIGQIRKRTVLGKRSVMIILSDHFSCCVGCSARHRLVLYSDGSIESTYEHAIDSYVE